jgi:tetratricopeptide (TPR) repeat protein
MTEATRARNADIGQRMRHLSALAFSENDFEAAQTYADAWALAEPSSADAWHTLAAAFAKQKRFRPARDCLQRAVACDPKRISAWVDMAEACIAIVDYKAASDVLRVALELDPEGKNPAGRRARAIAGRTLMKLRSLKTRD